MPLKTASGLVLFECEFVFSFMRQILSLVASKLITGSL